VKQYRQYCGLARGLDLVGDRWTLLVIRELAMGDRRYGQLLHDLPGIPTNLLAERLRVLGNEGLVEPVDIRTGERGYALTARGRDLVPVLHGLVRWATPTMVDGPHDGDRESIRWVAFAAAAYLRLRPPPSTVAARLTCGADDVTVRSVRDGTVTVDLDDDGDVDVVIEAGTWALMGLISGLLPLDDLHRIDPTATVTGSATGRRRIRALVEQPQR